MQLIAQFRVAWIGHNGKKNVAAKTPVKIKKEIYMLMMGLVPSKDMQTPTPPKRCDFYERYAQCAENNFKKWEREGRGVGGKKEF